MCEQTKVYADGECVWVKLSNCWWPGEVHEESRLPDDLMASLKRKPFAVVKFFQEDSYEYVNNINNIHMYQCDKKVEFIKKGLDLHRANYKYMEKFPADVETAERRTNGDPNIIHDAAVLSAGKQTPNKWADIFTGSAKKPGTSTKRGQRVAPSNSSPQKASPNAGPRKAEPLKPPPQTMRMKEHEVKILSPTTSKSTTDTSANPYTCHLCDFSSSRMNVVILHSKMHANSVPTPTKKAENVKKKSASPLSTAGRSKTQPSNKSVTKSKTEKTPKKPAVSATTSTTAVPTRRQLSKASTTKTTKAAKSVAKEEVVTKELIEEPKSKNIKLKNELLKDWSEDEEDLVKTKTVNQVNEEKPTEQPVQSSPIRCRNIPKKERRAFEELISAAVEEPELMIVQKKKRAIVDFQKEENNRLDVPLVKTSTSAQAPFDLIIEKDSELSSQINSLLSDTTELTKSLEETVKTTDDNNGVDKQQQPVAALPPKERGKRFFKSRHQINTLDTKELNNSNTEVFDMNETNDRGVGESLSQTSIAQIPRKRKYESSSLEAERQKLTKVEELRLLHSEPKAVVPKSGQNGCEDSKQQRKLSRGEDVALEVEEGYKPAAINSPLRNCSKSSVVQSKDLQLSPATTSSSSTTTSSPSVSPSTVKIQSQKYNSLQKVQTAEKSDLKDWFDSKLLGETQFSSNSAPRVVSVQEVKSVEMDSAGSCNEVILKTNETAAAVRKEDDSSLQDNQLLAIPGETFGGPPSSFFLCTVDDGNFVPIDNQPLYLDESNQLVPRAQTPLIIIESDEKPLIEEEEDEEETVQIIIGPDEHAHVVDLSNEDQKYLLNAGNGRQILLDQQSLLAIATGSEVPRFITAEGQEVIFDGTPQEILSSITLPQSDVEQDTTDSMMIFSNELLQLSTSAAQVSETTAIQPPIMSTIIVPSTGTLLAGHENGTDSLEEQLESVIGVKASKGRSSIPSSLELPITITNPVIVSKTSTPTVYNMTTISDNSPVVLEREAIVKEN